MKGIAVWGSLLVAVCAVMLGGVAWAQGGPAMGTAPVNIQADHLSYDRKTQTYHAVGEVQLKRGNMTLLSDAMTWNTASGEAVATGHVKLSSPDGVLEGETLRLNTNTQLGSLTNGKGYVDNKGSLSNGKSGVAARMGLSSDWGGAAASKFYLTGKQIDKTGPQSYRVERGTVTSCSGDAPSWKFGARELNVTVGGFARAKNALFYLKDIPVLYIPYVAYPANRGRVSGFLMPRYGYSSRHGLEFSDAYYLVLGRNMDATFYLDLLGKSGIGEGGEYRYILGDDNRGNLHLYHLNGYRDTKSTVAGSWTHQGTLPGDVWFSADTEYVSNRNYFKDFGETSAVANKTQNKSIVFAHRAWDKLNLTGQMRYIQNLETDNSKTLQRLPELNLAQVQSRLGTTPFYFKYDTYSTYFWSEKGLKGERLMLDPALTAAFNPGGAVEIVPELGYIERLYWTNEGDVQKGLPTFSTRVGTRFSRVYQLGGPTLSKIRHTVEPELTYTYIPTEDQTDLPQFDNQDQVSGENQLALALTNRLTAKFVGDDGLPVYREFLYFRLTQGVNLHRIVQKGNANQISSVFIDTAERLTPLRGELVVKPTTWSYFDLDGHYALDAASRGWADFNARSGVKDQAGNGFAIEYHSQKSDIYGDKLKYLSGSADLAVFKPIYLNYQQRLDIENSRTLEKDFNVEYRAQCWSVMLTYRDFLNTDNVRNREYLFTFTLSGVGQVLSFGGNLGTTATTN
ncbi:MAG TPA: LPS assembly protein LptD [Desulfuromonadales bacterium]|nr:LPS assembly protein LptD [Desulfuromonadales bacterium]